MTQPTFDLAYERDPKTLDNSALEFLRNYWQDKRAGRPMPTRADLTPTALRKHLDSIAMIDVLADGTDFRYRLVGTALTQYFLKDPTGLTIAEAWPEEAGPLAARVRANLCHVVAARVPVHVYGTLQWPDLAPEAFAALYVPFSEEGEKVTMIVNLFTFDRQRILPNRQAARQQGRPTLLNRQAASAKAS